MSIRDSFIGLLNLPFGVSGQRFALCSISAAEAIEVPVSEMHLITIKH